jgi:IMP and pyridine-specific 5'-nucleotidase
MRHGTRIGIVTAAGYTEAERYYGRLHGLLEAIKSSEILTPDQKNNIVVMGGSSCSLVFSVLSIPDFLIAFRRGVELSI